MYLNGTHRNTCEIHARYMQDTFGYVLYRKPPPICIGNPPSPEVPPTRRAGKAYRYCTAIDNGVDTPLSLAREMLNRRRCARQLAARRGHRRAGEDRRTQLMMMIMG